MSEVDDGGTTRCGRCADILPDETMTFCPACGVPFSEVPATNSFELLSDRQLERLHQIEQIRRVCISACVVTILWLGYGILSILMTGFQIQSLTPQPRHIAIYTYDVPGFPELSKNARRAAVGVALQAFEDHFDIDLREVSLHEDQVPPQLLGLFAEKSPWSSNGKGRAHFQELHFWERKVFPALTRLWQNDPQAELPVFVTNIPVFVGDPSRTDIETEHLSQSGVVSGLGHPSLVLVSTYRIANHDPKLDHDRPQKIDLDADKARYLGEYLIAHELGHALLGLNDYVVEPKPAGAALRGPASFDTDNDIESGVCLMHTDRGGGFEAWAKIRERTLGTPTRCHAYDAVLQNFKLRSKSIALLKAGKRAEAERLHAQAIAEARKSSQGWVVRTWTQEHVLFTSVFRRWWSSLFMVESGHDQL